MLELGDIYERSLMGRNLCQDSAGTPLTYDAPYMNNWKSIQPTTALEIRIGSVHYFGSNTRTEPPAYCSSSGLGLPHLAIPIVLPISTKWLFYEYDNDPL